MLVWFAGKQTTGYRHSLLSTVMLAEIRQKGECSIEPPWVLEAELGTNMAWSAGTERTLLPAAPCRLSHLSSLLGIILAAQLPVIRGASNTSGPPPSQGDVHTDLPHVFQVMFQTYKKRCLLMPRAVPNGVETNIPLRSSSFCTPRKRMKQPCTF